MFKRPILEMQESLGMQRRAAVAFLRALSLRWWVAGILLLAIPIAITTYVRVRRYGIEGSALTSELASAVSFLSFMVVAVIMLMFAPSCLRFFEMKLVAYSGASRRVIRYEEIEAFELVNEITTGVPGTFLRVVGRNQKLLAVLQVEAERDFSELRALLLSKRIMLRSAV